MGALENAMGSLLVGGIICLAVMIFLCLIRAIKGPRITDRIVAVNMIGTMVIIIICMLAVYLKESYLVDVAIIYAMISFLSVIVLCKVFTGVYLEKKMKEENERKTKESQENAVSNETVATEVESEKGDIEC